MTRVDANVTDALHAALTNAESDLVAAELELERARRTVASRRAAYLAYVEVR